MTKFILFFVTLNLSDNLTYLINLTAYFGKKNSSPEEYGISVTFEILVLLSISNVYFLGIFRSTTHISSAKLKYQVPLEFLAMMCL